MKYVFNDNGLIGFKTDDIHTILPSDIPISDEYWNLFLEKQTKGSNFTIKNLNATSFEEMFEEEVPHFMTEEEFQLLNLRNQREVECFSVINRGTMWYKSLTPEQSQELEVWYQEWLKVTETLIVPTKPSWLV